MATRSGHRSCAVLCEPGENVYFLESDIASVGTNSHLRRAPLAHAGGHGVQFTHPLVFTVPGKSFLPQQKGLPFRGCGEERCECSCLTGRADIDAPQLSLGAII